MRTFGMAAVLLAALACNAVAGEAEVVAAKATWSGGSWRFDVTLKHGDKGWEHYADAWRVVGPDGTVFGTRTLYHPHVDEQPFTRSLSGVTIPQGTGTVQVQARDSVHGWNTATFEVSLPR
ncbi:MAG: hypothetical protein AB8B85_03700 [Paracoccaceae bacterium]